MEEAELLARYWFSRLRELLLLLGNVPLLSDVTVLLTIVPEHHWPR